MEDIWILFAEKGVRVSPKRYQLKLIKVLIPKGKKVRRNFKIL